MERIDGLCKEVPWKPKRCEKPRASAPEDEKKRWLESEEEAKQQEKERAKKLPVVRDAERDLETSNPVYSVAKGEVLENRPLEVCEYVSKKDWELVKAKLKIVLLDAE